jgi:hypothetical protein
VPVDVVASWRPVDVVGVKLEEEVEVDEAVEEVSDVGVRGVSYHSHSSASRSLCWVVMEEEEVEESDGL